MYPAELQHLSSARKSQVHVETARSCGLDTLAAEYGSERRNAALRLDHYLAHQAAERHVKPVV
jgi:hypothetical protein